MKGPGECYHHHWDDEQPLQPAQLLPKGENRISTT
jgi:hypothetical protein